MQPIEYRVGRAGEDAPRPSERIRSSGIAAARLLAVRVVTLNVWGPGENWEARRPVLAEGLRDLRPDLVALQEIIVRDGRDQARELFGNELTLVHQQKRQ